MVEERHLPPRDAGRTEASAPMKRGAPPKILPVEIMDDDFPIFLAYLILLLLVFFFRQDLLQYS